MLGLRLLLMLVLAVPAMAQYTFYAPDFRSGEGLNPVLGLVNPERDQVFALVTAYDAQGQELGSLGIAVQPYGRFESANPAAASGAVAWLKIESNFHLGGYVRYQEQGGDRTSMASLVTHVGHNLYVPALIDEEELPLAENLLVNVGGGDAQINSEPYRRVDVFPLRAPARTLFDNVGRGHQTGFTYNVFEGLDQYAIYWDQLQSETMLTGIQHFIPEEGGMVSVPMQLTPYRELIVTDLGARRGQNRILLINTNADPMEILRTTRDIYGNTWEETINLRIREKIILDLDDPFQNPVSMRESWTSLKPLETGLVAMHLTARADGRAAVNPTRRPATVVNLAYTPSSDDLHTKITLINTSNRANSVYLDGNSNVGRSARKVITLLPHERRQFTTDEMFGEAAARRVTWMRIYTNKSTTVAYSMTENRSGSGDFVASDAMETVIRNNDNQVSGFEFIRSLDLPGQGWEMIEFNDDTYRNWVLDELRNRMHDDHSVPETGQFYVETAHFPAEGQHYLAYNPLSFSKQIFDNRDDRILFVSPFVDVPAYDFPHLSYEMRMFNPENGTEFSRYGLAWRLEGEDTWNWFGLTGYLLVIDPPLIIFDCWETVLYSTIDTNVTQTNWWKFQSALPQSVRGKRIQIGMFYDHDHEPTSPSQGPILMIDDIKFSGIQDEDALNYAIFGGAGTFTFSELEQEQPKK